MRGIQRSLLFGVMLSLSSPVVAQNYNRATEIDELGFTLSLTPGARNAGLAGACVSLVDDAYALYYNPAGLTRIGRIEASGGVVQERHATEIVFYEQSSSITTHAGALDEVAVAVPVPVLRGALVPAFGVFRVYSSYLDIHYQGDNPSAGAIDDYLLQQTGSIYAYTLGAGIAISDVLSGGVSAFLLDGSVSSLRQYDYRFVNSVPSVAVFVSDDAVLDIDGFGGRIGAQVHPHPMLRIGINFTSPIVVDAKGTALAEVTEHVDNNVDSYRKETRAIDTEYTIPFRVDAGVALTLPGVSVALEFAYADWTQAAIDGRRLRNPDLKTIFEEVVDLRGGVEWSLPWLPVRVRSGVASRPVPLRFFQEDRIVNDRMRLATEKKRTEWSLGVGGLIGGVVTIDAAFVQTDALRETENVEDSQSLRRYVLSAAYRF